MRKAVTIRFVDPTGQSVNASAISSRAPIVSSDYHVVAFVCLMLKRAIEFMMQSASFLAVFLENRRKEARCRFVRKRRCILKQHLP